MSASPSKTQDRSTAAAQRHPSQQPQSTAFFEGVQTKHDPFSAHQAGDGSFFQPRLQIHSGYDTFEAEADRVADQIVAAPAVAPDVQQGATAGSIQSKGLAATITPLRGGHAAQRLPAFFGPSELDTNSAQGGGEVQAKSEGGGHSAAHPAWQPPPPVQKREEDAGALSSEAVQPQTEARHSAPAQDAGFESRLHTNKSGGSPMPDPVREEMEAGFGADFSGVRLHTDTEAVGMNKQLLARAFTHGNDIYFNEGQYRPEAKEGKHLLAHELTHVVQQGHAVQAPVQKKADIEVTQTTPTSVQGLGISDALDYFADKAANIPGFTMLTVLLGFNPINMRNVERSAINIFRAIIGFMPGGELIFQALQNHGILEDIAAWAEGKLAEFGDIGNQIVSGIETFLDSLGWSDIFDLGGVWDRAKRIFTDPIGNLISFIGGLVSDILGFIKDAILIPLAALAEGTDGYDLLKAVLGEDPITGEPVVRTPEVLIGGFMKLIGQEEIWNNIQQSGAIPRAWAWFQNALQTVISFVSQIPGLFIAALQALEIFDIILVPRAFAKIVGIFGGFVMEFISWAGNAVWELLKIIFEVVAPGVLVYLNKAEGAFKKILADPIGFIRNLVNAGKLGFEQFAANFFGHLKSALLDWLLGAFAGAGIYIPQALEFKEILKFILSVLGLTWENVRAKLVERIGETPVRVLEEGFELIRLLVVEGPAAAWEKMLEHLATLKDLVVEKIVSFVTEKIVQSAIVQLIASLNPVTGFINAIIKIYNTIQFFMSRLQQIGQVAAAVIDAISDIANGVIAPAANKVEETLKGLLSLAINFLANFAGLGNVSEKISEVLRSIREPVDTALDKMIDWVVNTAKSFLKGKEEDKHGEIATAAVNEMQQGGGEAQSYVELRQAKEAQARQVEQKYQGQLEEGIGIRVVFQPAAEDAADEALDFEVVIAPNTTTSPGTILIQDDFKLPLGQKYLVKHSALGWVLGEVEKEELYNGVKLTMFNLLSGNSIGSKVGFANNNLKKDLEGNTKLLIQIFNNQEKGKPDSKYKDLTDIPDVGPFKSFTAEQKATAIEKNIQINGGKLVSDLDSSKQLVVAEIRKKGKKVNPSEVNIDHWWPRSEGGWNTYANVQVISFSENLKKSAALPI